jgi:hypothetical protein
MRRLIGLFGVILQLFYCTWKWEAREASKAIVVLLNRGGTLARNNLGPVAQLVRAHA